MACDTIEEIHGILYNFKKRHGFWQIAQLYKRTWRYNYILALGTTEWITTFFHDKSCEIRISFARILSSFRYLKIYFAVWGFKQPESGISKIFDFVTSQNKTLQLTIPSLTWTKVTFRKITSKRESIEEYKL